MKKLLRHREVVPAVLVVIAFIAGIIESPNFLDFRYLLETSSLYVEAGLMVLGMTLVIVCGQIDLSVGSMMALVACGTAKLMGAGVSIPVALALGVVFGALLGWVNGFLVARMNLPSFVVTLATMATYSGIAQVMVASESAKVPQKMVGIDYVRLPLVQLPLPMVLLGIVAVAMGLLLHRTVLGRWMFAVGTNEKASYFSGIPTARVKVIAFMLSGVMAALAGMMINSRLGVARFDYGRGIEVDVIAAVVVGGTSIYGGQGSILGSMLALMLIAFIRIGMGVAGVSVEYQLAAVGTLLIVAILVNNWSARLRGGRKRTVLSVSQEVSE